MARTDSFDCIGNELMTQVVFKDSGILLVDGSALAVDGVATDDISVDDVITKISVAAISDAAAKIGQVGKGLIEAGADKIGDAKEVELEFGITVGAGGRLFVVTGDVKAELKIKIRW